MRHSLLQLLASALVSPALISPAIAQSIQARFTVGATMFADEGTVTETTLGGSARFYFSRRWAVEPEFLRIWRNVDASKDRSSILWGNMAFDFRQRDRRIVPYWFGGPGIVRHTNSFGQVSTSTTEAAFGSGAGVRFLLAERVFLAPQFRFGVADGVFAEVTASIGFVLK